MVNEIIRLWKLAFLGLGQTTFLHQLVVFKFDHNGVLSGGRIPKGAAWGLISFWWVLFKQDINACRVKWYDSWKWKSQLLISLLFSLHFHASKLTLTSIKWNISIKLHLTSNHKIWDSLASKKSFKLKIIFVSRI